MEEAVERMEARLKLWGLEIDRLAAETQMAGVRVGFNTLIYVDELKALHAIAQSKLDAFKAAGGTERRRLKAAMRIAWNELDAAIKTPKP